MSDNINDKISSLLNDPESLKGILSLVSSMTKDTSGDAKQSEPPKEPIQDVVPVSVPAISTDNLGEVARENRFVRHDEDRINLLRSIRPFLDDRKRHKVDGIIRALGAARIINKYKDEDILGQLGFK